MHNKDRIIRILQDVFDGIDLQPPSDDDMAAEINTEPDTARASECSEGEPVRRRSRMNTSRLYACARCQCLLDDRARYMEHAQACYGNVRASFADELGDPRVVEFDEFPEIGTCYVCKTFKQLKHSILVTHEFICEKRDWYGDHGASIYIPPMSEWIRVAGKLVPPPEFLEVVQYFDAVGNWPAHEREYLTEHNKCFFTPCADEYVAKASGQRAETLGPSAADADGQIRNITVKKGEPFAPLERSK